jgi:hypothetical protein
MPVASGVHFFAMFTEREQDKKMNKLIAPGI